jgi:hypothetical protein
MGGLEVSYKHDYLVVLMRRGVAEVVPEASRLDANFDHLLFFENFDHLSPVSFYAPFDSRELAWCF